jgi:hypothetical protein
MRDLNREFDRQNAVVEDLNRKKEKSSRSEQEDLNKQIKAREKELDLIRKKLMAVEDLYKNRNQESERYEVQPTSGSGAGRSSGGHEGSNIERGLVGTGIGKMMGLGKFAFGLAGISGITSMAMEAYQKAFDSQVTPMDLSQRIRGDEYSGSAKGMWDTMGDIGRRDKMGYTSAESWQFQDSFSRQAGALSENETEHALKFGRAYGLDVQETASSLSAVKELGGTTSPSEFSDMIGASVAKSGMTPRILEVMQTSAGLLGQMNTTLKDTGAKQILAYQTTLDTIGMEQGMMKLTGQQGANIIGGLGGIYTPGEGNNWKYMGMQALQRHNPKKYGNMGLYDLEMSFEDGLMNEDNLPAMADFLKEKSGGNEDLMKRMLQRWLQDGGYNATKRQVDDLYSATDGLNAFDKDKMADVMKDLENGDGTAKYQERMGQLGQKILDVNSRFDKQLENIGQPILTVVTELKETVTEVLEAITSSGDPAKEILDFMKEHWKELATVGAIAGLGSILTERLPLLGGGGKDDDDDSTVIGDKDKKKSKSKKKKKKSIDTDADTLSNIIPFLGLPTALTLGTGYAISEAMKPGSEEQHKEWAKNAGLDPKTAGIGTDRFFTELASVIPFVDEEDVYKYLNPKNWLGLKEGVEGFFHSGKKVEDKAESQKVHTAKTFEEFKRDGNDQLIKFKENGKTELDKVTDTHMKWADGFKTMWGDFIEIVKELIPGGSAFDNGNFGSGYDVTRMSGVTGKQLDSQLKGELSGQGLAFMRAGNKYGIDPAFLASVAMHETGNGTSNAVKNKNNVGGMMGKNGLMSFESIEKGIEAMASNLKRLYTDKGLTTIEEIQKKYAPVGAKNDPTGLNQHWVNGVTKYMSNFGIPTTGVTADGFFKGWQNRITSGFGAMENFRTGKAHGGLDIDGNQGDSIQALAGGRIKFITMDDGGKYDKDKKKNTNGGGTEIGIEMENGETYFYSHLSKIAPKILEEFFDKKNKNATVAQGQYIGNIGGDRNKPGSGESTTGSHLHLGYLSKQGTYKNPMELMKALQGAGDSDVGKWENTASTKTIQVNVKLGGDVASLNERSESSLRKLISQAIKDYEQQKLLVNPTRR